MSPSVSHQSRSEAAIEAEPTDTALANTALSNLRFDLEQPLTAATLDSNAVELISLLFADVDRMLERGGVLPVELSGESLGEPVEAEPLQSGEAAGLDALAALLSSPLASADKLSPRELVPSFKLEDELEATPAPAVEPPESPAASKSSGSSLWLAALCGSLLLSAGILSFLYRAQVSGFWLTLLEKYRPEPVAELTSPEGEPGSSASAVSEQTGEQTDFLNYLKRSLERLSRHAELPPSPVASPAALSPSPSPIERVYIPIYPTTVSPAPALQQPARSTQPSSMQQAQQPAQPQVQPRVQPQAQPSVAAVPNIGAETNHTLIGVLELGERSAALFEVNGTPKRIEVGEQVGSSGWTLVSISNQEAIVRRNGEVRSIYVGQKF